MDKKPLESRKFLAFLISEATWKLALLVVLIMGMKNGTIDVIVGSIALAIVVVAGFIEAGFILGQASLDKYTRIAEIAANNGKSINMKGMQMTASPSKDTTNTDPPAGG